ncbi:MAG: hypothetical protein IPO90_01400 [Flavobacteriales bacterium]|nr:hypothetical protein [Flavobacteriales bacterium]
MLGFTEILTVVAAGSLKMLVAAGFGAGFGFTLLQNFLFTSLGGCIGVLVFYRLSAWLSERARLKALRKRTEALAINPAAVSRIFTRHNRWLIRLKHNSGLRGVAALTPLVLTIPLGSILAARYFRHDRRTIPALLLSVVLQAFCVSAVLSGGLQFFASAVQ